MNLNEYQELTGETAVYPGRGTPLGLIYCTLGLGDESGEALGKIKKGLRDDLMMEPTMDGTFKVNPISEERRQAFKKELGDVMWYIARAAAEAGFTLEEVAKANVSKLLDRKDRGVLQGSGDNR